MTTRDDASDELSRFADLLDDEARFADTEPDDPRRRRRRVIRGLIITAVVLALIIGTPAGYIAWALNAPVDAPVVSSQAPAAPAPAAASLALPTEGASAISVSGGAEYLGEAAAGIWATSGTNDARPIASVTKLITALVVLDAHPLDSATDPGPTLTFDEADHDLYDAYYVQGATIAPMPEGSSMSLRDAIATMLIPSASNYADAVASWAFGSHSRFVGAARTWLAAQGLTATTIVEPTGLSERNTSTPTDLIALGRLAAAHPAVAAIAATPSMTVPGAGRLNTTNSLLGVDGVSGLKTGSFGEGTFNLLYTALIDVGIAEPLAVTGVMLGGTSRASVDASATALLRSIRAGFHDVPLAAAGDEVGSLTTAWGSSATIVVSQNASVYTWSDTAITVSMQTTPPVTYQDGEVVGTITWTAGPRTETTTIEIEGTIEQPTETWRLTHPGELGAPWDASAG